MSTVNEDDPCRVCGKTYRWHQANKPQHPFTPEGGSLDFLKRRGARDHTNGRSLSPRGSETSPIPVVPTDPVLRIALINRGVINPADLVVAEQQLREALEVARREDGEPSESSRRGQVQE